MIDMPFNLLCLSLYFLVRSSPYVTLTVRLSEHPSVLDQNQNPSVRSRSKMRCCGALLVQLCYDFLPQISETDRQALELITYIGCALSIVGAILTVLTYIVLR